MTFSKNAAKVQMTAKKGIQKVFYLKVNLKKFRLGSNFFLILVKSKFLCPSF